MDAVALVTVGGFTLLFFFWAYGVLAFVRDARRYYPRVRAWLRERRADRPAGREDADAEDSTEEERYLY